MPRTPLQQISANRQPLKELTPYERGLIAGAASVGATATEISTECSVAVSTIRETISKAPQRRNGESVRRPGRPKLASKADIRLILRLARKEPEITYTRLRTDTALPFSDDTFYRILRAAGITNWLAKRRPKLIEEHAKKRLTWAKAHRDWTDKQWATVIWSDECSVERGSGKNRKWVFRTPGQKWQRDMIQEYKKGKDVSVMVWAAFSGFGGRSDIYIMDRDFESKKMGYSARSYIEVLDEMIPTLWDPRLVFMQDNAPIHCAKAVTAWFADNAVNVMENWPPYSPDLNPIEHMWWELKKRVYDVKPDIDAITGPEAIREALGDTLRKAWELIDKGFVEKLVKSMPDRVDAVIKAHGWHTKY